MAEGNPEKPKNPNNQLSDSDTSDEQPINPILKSSVDERHYGTIPDSVLILLWRGPSCIVRVRKLPKEKATDKSTQTDKQNK